MRSLLLIVVVSASFAAVGQQSSAQLGTYAPNFLNSQSSH